MSENRVLNKIKKLLELSKSSNLNEAESAAAMAQELMFAHKIEVADLEVETGQARPEDPIVEELLEGSDESKRASTWRSVLCNTIADAFGCHVWRVNGTSKINVFGRASDVQTMRYMHGYLARELQRICEAGWQGERGQTTAHGAIWKRSFYLGAIKTIGQRLKDQHGEQERRFAATGCQALVLVKRDAAAVEEAWKVKFKKSGFQKGRRVDGRQSSDAYELGREAGRKVSLGGSGRGLPSPAARLEE